MPAQKLTKARLAQILIMLSLLVGAFFWRTFTYEASSIVDCSQKQRCDVTIGPEKIIINKATDGFSLESSESDSVKVDLNQSGEFIVIDDNHHNVAWSDISKERVIHFKSSKNIIEVQL
ncbi:hypothetical protein [Vibrio sp. PNB23_22_7]